MGFFSSKQTIGTMRLDFFSKTEVAVRDTIPDATTEAPYPLWFAFLYAGKMLYNFGASGSLVLADALRILNTKVDEKDVFSRNASLLGTCCPSKLEIVNREGAGQCVYEGELFQKGDNLLVNTKVASGYEPHFHRAAIDTVFEVVRRRLGKAGSVVPLFMKLYFEALQQTGTNDFRVNLERAASVAMMAHQQTLSPEDEQLSQ